MLGTGGSQFPITIKMDEENEVDARLYVNLHLIKICFQDSMGSSDNPDVISLRYTIDFPKMELHPFNTKLFTLFYADE